jgi:hypothetical protein
MAPLEPVLPGPSGAGASPAASRADRERVLGSGIETDVLAFWPSASACLGSDPSGGSPSWLPARLGLGIAEAADLSPTHAAVE